MLVRIVGLGPGDPALLTLGSLDALRSASRVTVVSRAARSYEVPLRQRHHARTRISSAIPPSSCAGSTEEIERFVERVDAARDAEDLALGVLGNPFSDLPGLPPLLRALEARGIRTEIMAGMARATIASSLEMPLVPLPPQSHHYTFQELIEIMARLRLGCPWDREQTHRTLVPYLIEETYEVVEAIEAGDMDALCEELGDLLLQIVFHSQLGSEVGKFTVADVIDALSNKMVRRHPHVFGDAVIEDVDFAMEKLGSAQGSRKNRAKAQEPPRWNPEAPRRFTARSTDARESFACRFRLARRRRRAR